MPELAKIVVAGVLALLAACSTTSSPRDGGAASCPAAAALGADSGGACTNPGGATPGAADTHCAGIAQPTSAASCHPSAAVLAEAGGGAGAGQVDAGSGDDGGAADAGNCQDPAVLANLGYGPTMYGNEGGDDDCKYDVSWTSTPICRGQPVYFSVTVKSRADQSPVTCAKVYSDVVLTCQYPASGEPAAPAESSPGTYVVGPVVLDQPGNWVVRFHVHGECVDLLPTSPHGHAAFWVTVH